MVDTLVGLLDTAEEALDRVRVRVVFLLVSQTVVYARQRNKTDEIVVGFVLVGDQERCGADVLGDGVPCRSRP